MARPRKLYCHTCQADEPHRPLSGAEKAWLREHIGKRYVEDFFMCTAPDCRNVRTGGNKRPFDTPVRLPDLDG